MHFGTPTPRSDSGTLEEFEAAVARHKEDPSSVSVMFYFKDAPRAPMDIDPEQLQKVQEFRKKYKEEGIYGTFTDTVTFKETLQINLTRLAIEWQRVEKTGRHNSPIEPLGDGRRSRRWRIPYRPSLPTRTR